MTVSSASSEPEPTPAPAPPLFVRGHCSACGRKAQKRMTSDDWFHVNVYNDFMVMGAGRCPEAHLKEPQFLEGETENVGFSAFEPHFREVEYESLDWEHLDASGDPTPVMKTQPVVCTCTNPSCPGWGKAIPQWVLDLDGEKIQEKLDGREPKPCPKCGEVCAYDGWDHVHSNTGLGIGSCRS